MIIPLKDIPEDGLPLSGELATKDYDLPLGEYLDWEAIDYDLNASIIGTECLIRGSLSSSMKVACARCLDPLPLTLSIDAFEHSYPTEGVDSIDLTQDIREDILLALPLAPRCELDEKSKCPITGKTYAEGDDTFAEMNRETVWGALEKLKKKKKE